MSIGIPLESLPKLNASLNAACTVFLVLGFLFIRSGKIRYHRFCMIVAFLCSTVFLGFYVYFHLHAGVIRFGGQGWIRAVNHTQHPHDSGGGYRAANSDYAVARPPRKVCQPSCDRPLDVASVALRLRHRRNCLLAALYCLRADLAGWVSFIAVHLG